VIEPVPLYEYECPTHGRFELIRKFSDPPVKKCPTCDLPVEKLASSPAIQFKGTGWYVTDYARKGNGSSASDSSAASSDSKSESKSDKSETKSEKSEKKNESKGETKTDAKPAASTSSSTSSKSKGDAS
jgi:putative FmdB family regulatory protein